jgi:hypothetical protein
MEIIRRDYIKRWYDHKNLSPNQSNSHILVQMLIFLPLNFDLNGKQLIGPHRYDDENSKFARLSTKMKIFHFN